MITIITNNNNRLQFENSEKVYALCYCDVSLIWHLKLTLVEDVKVGQPIHLSDEYINEFPVIYKVKKIYK